jgi:hypothetical protein
MNGSDSFQTFPGGLLSIFLNVVIIGYSIIRYIAMAERQDWSITQQTIVADLSDL